MKIVMGAALAGMLFSTVAGAADIKPNVIYGNDGRRDYYEAIPALKKLADSSVALFKAKDVSKDGFLALSSYRLDNNLCRSERFSDQLDGAFCSGALVAPDIVMTAGHCITSDTECANTKLVFGFAIKDPESISMRAVEGMPMRARVNPGDIYGCSKLLSGIYTMTADYALVRLDRPVKDHAPLALNTSGNIAPGTRLFVIGHPSGLPQKITTGGVVRSVQDEYFSSNLDTYGGNSGSPVFNMRTRLIEGILVRGDTDFVETDAGCNVSKVNPSAGGHGEDVTRVSIVYPHLLEALNPGGAAVSAVAVPVPAVPAASSGADVQRINASFSGN